MTFEVGSLAASLRIEGMSQFEGDLQRVGDKLDRAGQRGSSFGRAGEAAVRKAAGATVALTAAAGAYVTILARTGVEYNSMQQNSRAALSTILGGAEKANAQMAQLDDFARNSPFSKGVFIGAQQQLLAFGVEAQKVIPYLDGIQNAIAASGGSNADLEAVATTIAKIQSSAKITAQDFIEFGNRGINAAELIGSQMGKTGAEIRESVTEGTLGATEAMDALIAGMTEKFGGATDLIKQQWSGAVDRVKAANRDIGAAIAEPFVSAEGGGMAVMWANQVADVLRAVEKQAVPVMQILTNRGAPIFSGLTTGLDKAAAAVARWDSSKLETFFNNMSNHAPAIGLVAGSLGALGTSVGPLGALFGSLGMTINPVLGAFIGLAAASPELRQAAGDLIGAFTPLGSVLGDVAKILSTALTSAMPVVADGIGLVVSVAKPLVDIISAIPTPLLIGAGAFLALHKTLGPVEGGLGKVLEALRGFGQRAQVQAALGETSIGVGAISTAAMGAKSGVEKLGVAMKTAFLSNPIGIALTVVSTAIGLWAGANAAAQAKVEEHNSRVAALRDTLNATTGDLTNATAAMVDKNLEDTRAKVLAEEMGIKYKDVQNAILGEEDALRRVNQAMDDHIAATTTGDANLDTWSATATNAKNRVRELTPIIEEHRQAIEDAQQATRDKVAADREHAASLTDVERSNQRFNDALSVARDTTVDATTRINALKQALDELNGGQITAEEAAKKLSAANLTLGEGLALTNEEGTKLWQATLDGAGSINLASREGLAFADTMAQSRDAMLDAAMAASDQALANGDLVGAVDAAKSAGDRYIETLRETMSEAGLTQEQIDGLIGKYLDVPDIVATLLTDNNTISDVDQRTLALIASLNAVPEGETVTIEDPQTPEVIKRMKDLGFEVKELPDGKVQITATGDQHVRDVLSELTTPRSVSVFLNPVRTGSNSDWHPPMALPNGGGLSGNLYTGGVAQAFATGGFSSGFYKAPAGQDAIHKFAERELAWEAYISPKPGFESKNIKIAMEALDRLGFPVVPASALKGVPGFASGKMVDMNPRTPAPGVQPRYEVSRQSSRRGPLANTVNIGVGASHNDLLNLAEVMDRLEREV